MIGLNVKEMVVLCFLSVFVHFHPSYPLPVVCTCGDILESYITRGRPAMPGSWNFVFQCAGVAGKGAGGRGED